MTRFEHVQNLFKRAIAQESSPRLASIDTPVRYSRGDYLMKTQFGIPPVEQLLLVDTGSDLTWIQCLCIRCFEQQAPFYNPRGSSTYKKAECNSKECSLLSDSTTCSEKDNQCVFSIRYLDSAATEGFVMVDTMSIISGPKNIIEATFSNLVFGCGRINSGGVDGGESGLLGLGGGSESIIRQHSDIIGNKFSHCLTSATSKFPGKISFGTNATIYGDISTPLFERDSLTFYLVALKGISVGKRRLKINSPISPFRVGGHLQDYMAMDMGTTLTYLQASFYKAVEAEMVRQVNRTRVYSTFSNLCFRESVFKRRLESPPITLHFPGADLVLLPRINFVKVANRIYCFIIKPTTDDYSIFGNMHSVNLRIGFDLVKEMVYFQRMDCVRA